MSGVFLTAEWRKLILINYEFDPEILKKYLPHKTELDTWNNTCYVSLVGFKFCNTKVKGIKIPFHSDFEEVNLRFYVRHKASDNQWRRGVVFVKEIVPKAAITFFANLLYNEHYQTLPMTHYWKNNGLLEVEYKWKLNNEWQRLMVKANPDPKEVAKDCEIAFITEHYWGYNRVSDSRTSEYEVQHPIWQVYDVQDYDVQVDTAKNYGEDFKELSQQKPKSVFLAEGSEITVKQGKKI